jgi:predicted nucleic acid-binding protein
MNGNSLLLDTNIILYLLNGDETLIPLLEEKNLFVSFITELELLSYKELTHKDSENIGHF